MPAYKSVPSAIELQSLIDSHANPFVVIGSDYRILAVNQAYEQVYNARRAWRRVEQSNREESRGGPC